MKIWLIIFPLAVSLFILFGEGIFHRPELFVKRRWHSELFFGFAWYVLTRFVAILVFRAFTLSAHGAGLYLRFVLSSFLPFWGFGLLGIAVLKRLFSGSVSVAVYVAGYGCLSGLAVILSVTHAFDLYILFVLPFLLASLIIYLIEGYELVSKNAGYQFAISVAGLVTAPFFYSLVPFFYYRGFPLFSFFLCVLFVLPGFVLFARKALSGNW